MRKPWRPRFADKPFSSAPRRAAHLPALRWPSIMFKTPRIPIYDCSGSAPVPDRKAKNLKPPPIDRIETFIFPRCSFLFSHCLQRFMARLRDTNLLVAGHKHKPAPFESSRRA